MMRARSSAFACRRWNHFIRMAARSFAVLLRHAGHALLAAARAALVSTAPRFATSTSFCPVAGSVTAKRFAPPVHSPPIKASVFKRVGSFSEARGDVFVSMGRSWLSGLGPHGNSFTLALAAQCGGSRVLRRAARQHKRRPGAVPQRR